MFLWIGDGSERVETGPGDLHTVEVVGSSPTAPTEKSLSLMEAGFRVVVLRSAEFWP